MTATAYNDVVRVANVVGVTGSVVTPRKTTSAVVTSAYTASLADCEISAADPSRVGVSVACSLDSGGYLYLNLGAPASTGSYVTCLWPGSYWEAPYGYTGTVHGVFTSITGSCCVSEYR